VLVVVLPLFELSVITAPESLYASLNPLKMDAALVTSALFPDPTAIITPELEVDGDDRYSRETLVSAPLPRIIWFPPTASKCS
jgi:hypothetical protein